MSEHLDFGPAQDNVQVDLDPQAEAKTFEVDKDLNLAQFQAELAESAGVAYDDLVLTLVIPAPAEDGTQAPATLWVSPDSIDGRKVRGAITAHDPDPNFGQTDEQKARAAVLAKVEAGEALSPEETSLALQALLAARG